MKELTKEQLCSGEHLERERSLSFARDGYRLSDLPPELVSDAPPLAKHQAQPSVEPPQLSMPAGNNLLAVDPQLRPFKVSVPKVCIPVGEIHSSVARICVSKSGAVTSVTVLRPSLPIIDLQLPMVLARWRFHPYLIDGQAAPFCYDLKYTVR